MKKVVGESYTHHNCLPVYFLTKKILKKARKEVQEAKKEEDLGPKNVRVQKLYWVSNPWISSAFW